MLLNSSFNEFFIIIGHQVLIQLELSIHVRVIRKRGGGNNKENIVKPFFDKKKNKALS